MKNQDLQKKLANRRGLKFTLSSETTNDTIVSQTLKNHGIKNVAEFANPQHSPTTNPLSFAGMDYWSHRFLDDTDVYSKVRILVDNDADGMTSSAMLYLYLKKINYENIDFIFSKGKSHGLSNVINTIIKEHPDFLFIPDSATNDVTQQANLTANSIPYLILDHHDIDPATPVIEKYLPIINNNRADNLDTVNPNFTGAGMAYMFCKQLDAILGHSYADELLYLFAIGQVGDVSDVSDLEIRHLMLTGFDQLDTPLLSKIVDSEHVSPHELSFSIIPKINAVCRVGSIEDKRNLLNGLVTNKPTDDLSYEIRRRTRSPKDNKIHVLPVASDYYEWESRQLNSVKSRQESSVKRSLKALEHIYETANFVAAVDYGDSFEAPQTGLIATKLANQYQKPALVLRSIADPHNDEETTLSGSGRGFSMIMSDFKGYLLATGQFEFCAGHPNAFGVGIKPENFQQLLKQVEAPVTVAKTPYTVDKVYLNSTPPLSEITEFDQNRVLFGGRVKDPALGFVGLKVAKNTVGYKGTTLTFMVNGLKFLMWGAQQGFVDKLFRSSGNYFYVDIYGEPDVSRYSRNSAEQILIRDIMLSQPIQSESVINFKDFMF